MSLSGAEVAAVVDPAHRRMRALEWLSLARQAEVDPAAAVVYQQSLADVDPATLETACRELGNEPRASFESAMPSVGAIRARVATLERRAQRQQRLSQLGALPAPVDDEDPRTRVYCRACQDTAWEPFWCLGEPTLEARPYPAYEACGRATTKDCGRQHSHRPHPYVAACTCLPHNPVIAARREREMAKARAAGDDEP